MHRGALIVAAALLGGGAASAAPPQTLPGWPLYDRLCLACHGRTGDGHGPAAPYVTPAPRAFTRGELKWRSVPVGQPALDDDLRQTILLGAPGTAMPGFAATLGPAQLDDVIAVVRALSPPPRPATAKPIALGDPPPPDPVRGAALFAAKGCPACHGPAADGHGPTSFALRSPPYNLTLGLHRPREPGDDAARRAAAMSIATGLTGTAMPSFAGTIAEADLWALADHIVGVDARPRRQRLDRPRGVSAAAIDADRKAPIATGTWPGLGDSDEVSVFGQAVPPQGAPPAQLAPAQASLRGRQCARCHAKQAREWETSSHRGAASPGLLAQTEYGMAADERAACLRCHAPLAEQATDAALRSDGVSCAGCHVRSWIRRGPPSRAPTLLSLPGYPLAQSGFYERADFCLPCHQMPPRTAVEGRPLLDTYKEWLDGPYLPRGVQCQHCHMANREHALQGVHDPQTFRQALQLDGNAHRRGAEITAVATLTNIGAGHYLPTTPTPAAWLTIELVDARGRAIAGASDRVRIGRDVWYDGTWHERSDTRIPPGEATTMARAWSGGRTSAATHARITVVVHPDDFYERFYAKALASRLAPDQRALYQQALARALGSRYTAEQRDVPIQP